MLSYNIIIPALDPHPPPSPRPFSKTSSRPRLPPERSASFRASSSCVVGRRGVICHNGLHPPRPPPGIYIRLLPDIKHLFSISYSWGALSMVT